MPSGMIGLILFPTSESENTMRYEGSTKSERREERKRKARNHPTSGRSVFLLQECAYKRAQENKK
jgi:hypothetical protein